MAMIRVVSGYCRDFKSKKEIEEHFARGGDFIIEDWEHPYCGKPVNREGLLSEGCTTVNVRYAKNRRVHVLRVK